MSATRVLVVGVALLTVACGAGGPTQPTPGPAGVQLVEVDGALAEAWRLVDVPVPPAVRRVVIVEQPYSGYWHAPSGSVWIGAHIVGSPPLVTAGVIVHELSHAEGLSHTCGTNPIGWTDDRGLGGPWGRQAGFLERLGRPDIAVSIRRSHICDPV
jgi:hypothetical protein